MNISLKDFLEVIDYSINDVYHYQWDCFGKSALSLKAESNDYSIGIIFDLLDQTVYEVNSHDYLLNKAYRMIHPEFVEKYFEESKEKGIDPFNAWDEVNYIDLEVEEDMLEKSRSIFLGEKYDTRILVPLNLSEDEIFILMKNAHDLDMTFNKYVENLLMDFIKNQIE
jgi:hypothetical protein